MCILPVGLRSHSPLSWRSRRSTRGSRRWRLASAPDFRRFLLVLAAFAASSRCCSPPSSSRSTPISIGSPSWRGFNAVRPYYEPHVLVAKPYQVRSQRPSAVALGSSRVEVGIDRRHAGWTDTNVFDFAIFSNSYAFMLAFCTRRRWVPRSSRWSSVSTSSPTTSTSRSRRLWPTTLRAWDPRRVRSFARCIPTAANTSLNPSPAPLSRPRSRGWNEKLYLAVNADVAAAIARKDFKSGREHYELAGRAERRKGTTVPADWDEAGYLQVHPDVAAAVTQAAFERLPPLARRWTSRGATWWVQTCGLERRAISRGQSRCAHSNCVRTLSEWIPALCGDWP